jgi:hypothetical protein
MVWNGPLHAPVLRPVFAEEPTIRWSRKNQTVRAFRPSGIPNQPVDHSLLKSDLVYNYKPEIEGNGRSEEEGSGGKERDRGGRGRGGRDRKNRGRDRDRGGQRQRDRSAKSEAGGEAEQPSRQTRFEPVDEDSIGNIRRPGEQPAPLVGLNDNAYGGDEIDDDIGNRLDSPPTSGHVGINGDGYLPPSRQARGGGSRSGGTNNGNNNQRRRGRRRGRRGGGQNRGNPPRGNHDSQ